jgi:hypothetical protein
VLAAWSLLLQEGCYKSLPLQQGPAPVAQKVWVFLNDRGRAALSDRLGSAVDRVEGTVAAADDSAYVLSVSRVFQLNGYSNGWTGESVKVAREYTTGFQVRQLDRFRTTMVAGGAAVAVIGFFVTRSLVGGGTPPSDAGSPPSQHSH